LKFKYKNYLNETNHTYFWSIIVEVRRMMNLLSTGWLAATTDADAGETRQERKRNEHYY